MNAAWQSVRVGDALNLTNGRAFKSSEWGPSGRPIVRIQNLNDPDAPFNYYDGTVPDKFRVQRGDLLFAWSGTPGTSFGAHIWNGPDAWLNQHIFKVQYQGTDFDPRYLRFALNQNLDEYIRAAHGGAGLAHVTKERFEASEIPKPPLHEQHALVAEIEKQFTRVDAGVAALRRLQAHLRRYRAAVLNAAAEGRLAAFERREVPEPLHGLTPQNAPPLPTTWRSVTLGSLIRDIQAGKNFRCVERPPGPAEYGVVKVSAVTWGTFDEEESKTCEPAQFDKELQIEPGDFLFSRANTIKLVGACVVVGSVRRTLMLSDKILRFLIDGANPRWVLWMLRSRVGRNEIERLATGNQESMRNISQERIRQVRIPLPPESEQEALVAEIESRMEYADQVDRSAESGLKRSSALRRAVLGSAFSGRLTPAERPRTIANGHK